MSRALQLLAVFVVLTALFVVGGVAAADGSSGTPVASEYSTGPTDGTTAGTPAVGIATERSDLETPARLVLGSSPTDGTTTVTTDVGTAMAGDGAATEARLRQLTLEQRLDGTTDDTERRDVFAEEIVRLEEDVATLRDRERDAYARYHRGEIDTRTFVRELSLVTDRAEATERTLSELERHLDSTPAVQLSDETDRLRLDLETTNSPVRSQVGAAMNGGEPAPVRTAATEDGVILASIADDTYYRDGYRADRRTLDGDELLGIDDIVDRVFELYPWVTGAQSPAIVPQSDAYEITATRDHARVVTYIDGYNGEVFHERQQHDLATLPTVQAVTRTDGDLRLVVDRTYPGGPARITVTDGGDPADATIELDGEPARTTSDAGEYWIVAPYDEATITATVDDRTVDATVDWTAGTRPTAENETAETVVSPE